MSAPEASADSSSGSETPPAGALQRLLEIERAAEEALARARTEGRELVEAARQRALDAEEAARRDLAGAAERLDLEIRAWRNQRRAALEAEAEAEVARYEAAGSDRVEELAGIVVDALLRGSPFEDR